jgi:hypothetical protein
MREFNAAFLVAILLVSTACNSTASSGSIVGQSQSSSLPQATSTPAPVLPVLNPTPQPTPAITPSASPTHMEVALRAIHFRFTALTTFNTSRITLVRISLLKMTSFSTAIISILLVQNLIHFLGPFMDLITSFMI